MVANLIGCSKFCVTQMLEVIIPAIKSHFLSSIPLWKAYMNGKRRAITREWYPDKMAHIGRDHSQDRGRQ